MLNRFFLWQERASNAVVSAPVAAPASIPNDVRSLPIEEAQLVALQAPEPQLMTPSSKGQRNLQDSTFSISGENPNGLHEPQSGSSRTHEVATEKYAKLLYRNNW